MKKYPHSLLICFFFLVTSCQTIDQLSIDYLVPSEVSFPPELRRVAIINNTSALHTNDVITDSPEKLPNELARQTSYPEGNASLAAEALAESIAEENYFDKVVICDSTLRANDRFARESTLSKEEVMQLTRELDVDFLISLENLQMKAVRIIRFDPVFGGFEGVVDVKVYPTVKIYLPFRSSPMVTITSNDSIFWQEFGATEHYVRSRLISNDQLAEEASVFAGTVPVQKLIPHWKTSTRYLYTGGSPAMRDAYVQSRREKWDEACALWLQIYENKKPKQQMGAAYNIAVYYEMQDEIEKAEEWLTRAQELARNVDKVESKSAESGNRLEASRVPNYAMTVIYMQELQERKGHLAKLNMQMKRFGNDF
ncbi:MAG: tetratricopeptide repeat protein [Bacteroides sp.]|nr:tetratricopeptide repeat protein [Bacteroides sp.]